MGKCAFNSAVSNFQSALHTVLVCTGNCHKIFNIIDIISFDYFIFYQSGILFNNRFFSLGVINRKSEFLLIFKNHLCSSHSFNKQFRHPGICSVYDFSCFFQFICHIRYPFQKKKSLSCNVTSEALIILSKSNCGNFRNLFMPSQVTFS